MASYVCRLTVWGHHLGAGEAEAAPYSGTKAPNRERSLAASSGKAGRQWPERWTERWGIGREGNPRPLTTPQNYSSSFRHRAAQPPPSWRDDTKPTGDTSYHQDCPTNSCSRASGSRYGQPCSGYCM